MATSNQVGDLPRKAVNATVASLPISVVLATDLASATAAVNDALVSGKRFGAAYLVSDGTNVSDIAIAQGTAPTDPWHLVSDAGEVPVVPA